MGGGEFTNRREEIARARNRIYRKLSGLAGGRSNDSVKLVFLNEEEAIRRLDDLDLSMLSEIKRGQNGLVEVKLISRLDVMRMILDGLDSESAENEAGADFFRALSAAGSDGE